MDTTSHRVAKEHGFEKPMTTGTNYFCVKGTCKSESETEDVADECGLGAKGRKSVLPMSNGLGERSFPQFDVRKCQTTSTAGILPRERGPGFRSSTQTEIGDQHLTTAITTDPERTGDEANSAIHDPTVDSASANDGGDGNDGSNATGSVIVSNDDGNATGNVIVNDNNGNGIVNNNNNGNGIVNNNNNGNGIGGGVVENDGADGDATTTTNHVLTTVTDAPRVSPSSTQVSPSSSETAIRSTSSTATPLLYSVSLSSSESAIGPTTSSATPLLSSVSPLIMIVAIAVLSIVLLLTCCIGVVFLRRRRVLGRYALSRGDTGLGHMDSTNSAATSERSVSMSGTFATLRRVGERESSATEDTRSSSDITISPYPQFPSDHTIVFVDQGAAQFTTRKSRFIPEETRLSREELSDAQATASEASQAAGTSHAGAGRESFFFPGNRATVQGTTEDNSYFPNRERRFSRNKTYLPQDELPDSFQTALPQSDLPRNTSQIGGLVLNVRHSQGPDTHTPVNANNKGDTSYEVGSLSSLSREMDEDYARISSPPTYHEDE